jgi:hypothetical protein
MRLFSSYPYVTWLFIYGIRLYGQTGRGPHRCPLERLLDPRNAIQAAALAEILEPLQRSHRSEPVRDTCDVLDQQSAKEASI